MLVAGVQMDVSLGDVEANLQKMLRLFDESARAGARLTVFPECALTGYCFKNLDEARPHAQPIPGPAVERFTEACRQAEGFAVFGMLEPAPDGGLFNACVLVGRDGLVGAYRKVHLPYLGVDQYTTFGDRDFSVYDAGGCRVGMNICYDSAFPESSRALALLGADLIVLPTNWPPGAECVAEHAINTRAMENGVYYVAVNRVGRERGFEFIGRSRICAPDGSTLATSDGTSEEILYADVDPERARKKRVVRAPGVHSIDRMADRRPEMYGLLTRPHELKRPGRDDGTS